MLKFMVVIYRRPELTPLGFRRHLKQVPGPLVRKFRGRRKYTQNFVCADAKRKSPGWDAIVELYFDNRAAMEAAWASPQGAASDADLAAFAELTRTTWSAVEDITVLQ